MILLKYNSENGDSVEFMPKNFSPLSYQDLICILKKENKLKIEGFADSFHFKKEPNKIIPAGKFSFDINFNHPPSIFVLVEGGWLPLPFANPGIFLVDRNVISVLSKISKATERTDLQHTDWWISLIQNSSFVINPILYAIEGDKQRRPSFNEFISSFEEASIKIAKKEN